LLSASGDYFKNRKNGRKTIPNILHQTSSYIKEEIHGYFTHLVTKPLVKYVLVNTLNRYFDFLLRNQLTWIDLHLFAQNYQTSRHGHVSFFANLKANIFVHQVNRFSSSAMLGM